MENWLRQWIKRFRANEKLYIATFYESTKHKERIFPNIEGRHRIASRVFLYLNVSDRFDTRDMNIDKLMKLL